MKGEKPVIQHLNEVLRNELSAINQYFLHARILGNWGLDDLEEQEYKQSIVKMKMADNIIKRILFLEGRLDLQNQAKLYIGGNVEEIIDCNLKMDHACHVAQKTGILLSEEKQDYVTREMLEDIQQKQEDHIDWLEAQQDLISKMGLKNYIQSQA